MTGRDDTIFHAFSVVHVRAMRPINSFVSTITVGDLRQFLADVDGARIPDDAYISVGGLNEEGISLGEKSWSIKRIEARKTLQFDREGMPHD